MCCLTGEIKIYITGWRSPVNINFTDISESSIYVSLSTDPQYYRYINTSFLTNVLVLYLHHTGFPLYSDIRIQGLSRTLNLHFQGPILDGSLQHGQYYSNI